MSYRQCEYETGDTIGGVPYLCDHPASVKIRGLWYCEVHADRIERQDESLADIDDL
jgi:hypothetical protein